MSATPAPEKPSDDSAVAAIPSSGGWRELWSIEDWWAVWLGATVLAAAALLSWRARPADLEDRIAALDVQRQELATNGGPLTELTKKQDELAGKFKAPFKAWIAKLQKWESNPLEAVYSDGKHNAVGAIGMVLVVSLVLLLPRTPAVYSYTWLPVLAVGSLYAGLALVTSIERARVIAGMRESMASEQGHSPAQSTWKG
jgi:hypothetical protein